MGFLSAAPKTVLLTSGFCFSEKIDSNAVLVRALLLLLVVQFFALYFACILCRAIRLTHLFKFINTKDGYQCSDFFATKPVNSHS
ncbi:hypothetical protein niasHS_010408 [Heterodera schachtii]|uniref:Uncharacterized protein n=1 Tax=Heterodera schachtii TaxID=97005 RepID=A0ABD2IZN9_HETSC